MKITTVFDVDLARACDILNGFSQNMGKIHFLQFFVDYWRQNGIHPKLL